METVKENLELSFYVGFEDCALFVSIWNIGIDSRLTAFTKSTHKISDNRLYLSIDRSEIEILIRRLVESENDNSDIWADDIVSVYYGYETV